MVDPERFREAVYEGDLAAVQAMIGKGVHVNANPDDHYYSPLHLAVEQGWLSIITTLLDAGADIEQKTELGWTPLAHAIEMESDTAWQVHQEMGRESCEVTQLLLARGAAPTPFAFEVATECQHQKALALLRQCANGLAVAAPGTAPAEIASEDESSGVGRCR